MSVMSMTGFGAGQASQKTLRASVELQTVNRKQLDVHINLPRGLQVVEARVQKAIADDMTRGRVNADIQVHWDRKKPAVRVNHELAGMYIKNLRSLAKKHELTDDLSASMLMSMPDVIEFQHVNEDPEAVWRVVEPALHKALKALNLMRGREGRALQKDLQQRLALLRGLVKEINQAAPKVAQVYRKSLMERLRKADLKIKLSDERLVKEVALFAEKSDITEEITRLKSHMNQVSRCLRSRKPQAGRWILSPRRCFVKSTRSGPRRTAQM